jgi:hypothetical protein
MPRRLRDKPKRDRPRVFRLALTVLVSAALSELAFAQGVPYGYLKIGAKSDVINTGETLLHGCLGFNNGGSTEYIQFFNSTSVPADGVAPSMVPIVASAGQPFAWDAGAGISRVFSTGLSWASSSTLSTKTLVAGNDISISCQYN